MIKTKFKKFKAVTAVLLILLLIMSPLELGYVTASANDDGLLDCSFEEGFDVTGSIHGQNGWYSYYTGEPYVGYSHQVENGALHVKDYSNGGDSFTSRTYYEAALNQSVEVDILNLGELFNYSSANVYLRFSRSTNYETNSDSGYFVEVTRDYIALKADSNTWTDKVQIADARDEYSYRYGHVYRVKFSAYDVNPTVLRATLYDVTAGNVAVAAVSATDYTECLQAPGVAALGVLKNQMGSETAIYDNFKYTVNERVIADDSFGASNGVSASGYSIGSAANVSLADNSLSLKTKHPPYVEDTLNSALLRPMSEAATEQIIEVEFNAQTTTYNENKWTDNYSNIGGVIIARCQDKVARADNCYRLVTEFNQNGYEWDSCPIQLIDNDGNILWSGSLWRKSSDRIRLSLSVTTKENAGQRYLFFTVFAYKIYDDGVTEKILHATASDYSSDLMDKPGTAGFAMFDKWGGTLNVYNFKYSTPVNSSEVEPTYNLYEAEDDFVYKNNYSNKAFAASLNGRIAASNEKMNSSWQDIPRQINRLPYIAYAVFAENAGNYSIKLRYRINNASGNDLFAPVFVNGILYKASHTGNIGELSTSDEVVVGLHKGLNIIYCMSAAAESGSDATIDYDAVFVERGLTALNGTFDIAGDANDDGKLNVIDIIRLKRYLSGAELKINKLAADLDTASGGSLLNVDDITQIAKLLLSYDVNPLKFTSSELINPLSVMNELEGGAEAEAREMYNNILSAGDRISPSAGGNTYYFSSESGSDSNSGRYENQAWASLGKLKSITLAEGDVILFERGSVFRQENLGSAIELISNTSVGAYGVGEKPKIYGSSRNYATENWVQDSENVWKINLNSNSQRDAGIIVFDDGSYVGVLKNSKSELGSGNDFFYDCSTGELYLYSALGNPADVYDSIEIGLDRYIIEMHGNAKNVKIDNLDIRYVGSHAISGNNGNSIVEITNCDMAYIGGSLQGGQGSVRYGNAIQFWGDPSAPTSGITVDNCRFYQVYDAGFTFQSGSGVTFENIFFTNNLVQYCNYSVEVFVNGENNNPDLATGKMSNIDIMNNIMQYAGYGFCEQRPSKVDSSHICGWETYIQGQIYDFCIINNIFDLANYNIVNWKRVGTNLTVINNNTFYMKTADTDCAMNYSSFGQHNATDQASLEAAVAVFDKKPAKVEWLDK